jgi:hypothetical protein
MTPAQRVLNYLSWTILSHGSMIQLYVHPLPPLPSVSRLAVHRKTEKERQHLAAGKEGEGAGKETNHSAARKPGSL